MISGAGGGGIDVNGLVSQLMTVERRPLVALQQKESSIQSRLSALGRVQSSLATLISATDRLRQPATFQSAKASVAGEGVAAAASGAAALGRYAVAVTQLARAQSIASAAFASATADVGSGTLTIRSADGTSVLATINVGDTGTGTLTEVRDEINAANIGVRATLVNDGGQTRLVLNSKETGVANGFQLDVDAGLSALAFAQMQEGRDAAFSINGLGLTSATNSISDVIEGVTFTLTKAPPAGSPPGTAVEAEIAVDQDPEAMKAAVQDFIKAYNDVEKLVGELTKFDPNTRSAAILNGESVMRQVQSALRGTLRAAMAAPAGDHMRLSEVGVEFQTDGTLKLNEARFADAVAADAARVSRLFTATSTIEAEQGFAVRLRTQAKSIVDPAGLLDSRQEGLRASIRTLDQQQERMQARLSIIEARLRRQYSQLDALLSSRQLQSNALGNALAGLPRFGSER